jgi:hypothetical protein
MWPSFATPRCARLLRREGVPRDEVKSWMQTWSMSDEPQRNPGFSYAIQLYEEDGYRALIGSTECAIRRALSRSAASG